MKIQISPRAKALVYFLSICASLESQVLLNTTAIELVTVSLNSSSVCYVIPDSKNGIINRIVCSSYSDLLLNNNMVFEGSAQSNYFKSNIFMNSGDSICIESNNSNSYCNISIQLLGNECFGDNQTSIPEIPFESESKISLQPSLVNSYTTVVQTNDIKGDFFIYDMRGAKVSAGYMDSSVKVLNLEFLVPGIYTFSFNNEKLRFVKL